METTQSENMLDEPAPRPFFQTCFHGTKADLKIGDLITIDNISNYEKGNKAKYIYLSATLDAAILGCRTCFRRGE